MSSPTVYLEVDGKPVPASECLWIQYGTCGCACSFVNAQVGDEVATSEEDLARQHDYSKAVVKRDREDGLRWRLTTFAAYRAMDTSRCPHTPRYGIPRVEVPPGYAWRTTDGIGRGRRTHRKHLIPLPPAVITGRAAASTTDVAALCGTNAYAWAWDDWTHDCVTCRACEKEARKTTHEPDPGLADVTLEFTP